VFEAKPSEKEMILKKIREGKVKVWKPGMKLREYAYIRAVGEKQPATVDEIAELLGKTEKGVKAILGRLIKKGSVTAVIYEGKLYYLLTEYYKTLVGERAS